MGNMKATAKATITFGLFAVPVKVFAAIDQPDHPSFNLLHPVDDKGKPCLSRLNQQLVCSKDHMVVDRDEAVKGYQVSKDEYVVFTEEELASLKAEKDEKIEVKEFVPASTVGPLFLEKPNYVGPDKGSDQPFAVLVQALRDTGRVGIGWWTVRGNRSVVMLEPLETGLVMTQLRFGAQVRSISALEIPEVSLTREMRTLAANLVNDLATDGFRPEKYVDDTRAKFERLLLAKSELVPSTVAKLRAALEAPVPTGWDKIEGGEETVEPVKTGGKQVAK